VAHAREETEELREDWRRDGKEWRGGGGGGRGAAAAGRRPGVWKLGARGGRARQRGRDRT
jgi:hypothetical protein